MVEPSTAPFALRVQILARNGQLVFEPGLRDTVHVRGAETATILSYFENPRRWMVHCHISSPRRRRC